MKKLYKIAQHNSTLCGYPARQFDWSKLCWDESEIYTDKCHHFGCEHKHIDKAPKVFVDSYLIETGSQYLHVPYNWTEDCTVYRLRPSKQVGETYRGKVIKSIKAIQVKDIWYWQLEFKEEK